LNDDTLDIAADAGVLRVTASFVMRESPLELRRRFLVVDPLAERL
jgi:hypothetical protein